MKKEIRFNEAELIGSMKQALAHAQGKLTLKTTTPPAPIRRVSPSEIARIRRQLNASITVCGLPERHAGDDSQLGEEPPPTVGPGAETSADREKSAGNPASIGVATKGGGSVRQVSPI